MSEFDKWGTAEHCSKLIEHCTKKIQKHHDLIVNADAAAEQAQVGISDGSDGCTHPPPSAQLPPKTNKLLVMFCGGGGDDDDNKLCNSHMRIMYEKCNTCNMYQKCNTCRCTTCIRLGRWQRRRVTCRAHLTGVVLKMLLLLLLLLMTMMMMMMILSAISAA